MPFHLGKYLMESASGLGIVGTVVGGVIGGRQNYKDYRAGKLEKGRAAYNTGLEAVGTGIATAVSVTAAGAVGGGLILSAGSAVVAYSAAKYLWDRGASNLEKLVPENETDADRKPNLAVVRSER
jgi:hypothetical protein